MRRNHLREICQRCFTAFNSKVELDKHLQLDCCKPQSKHYVGPWFDEETSQQLRIRAKRGSTEETKWVDVYNTIFPDACKNNEKIPSPCTSQSNDFSLSLSLSHTHTLSLSLLDFVY
jgi:hypothetical protein